MKYHRALQRAYDPRDVFAYQGCGANWRLYKNGDLEAARLLTNLDQFFNQTHFFKLLQKRAPMYM